MIGEPSMLMSMTPPQVRRYLDPRQRRDHCHAGFGDVLDSGEIAALGIGIVAVDIAAEDETALVRLRHVEMAGAKGDDGVDEGFQPLGDEGLQHMAFDRQRAGPPCRRPRWNCRRQRAPACRSR